MRRFMGRAPFAGAAPMFVGDDATDEDGFEAAQARWAAWASLVGRHRAVNARYRLPSVEAALAWLEAAL